MCREGGGGGGLRQSVVVFFISILWWWWWPGCGIIPPRKDECEPFWRLVGPVGLDQMHEFVVHDLVTCGAEVETVVEKALEGLVLGHGDASCWYGIHEAATGFGYQSTPEVDDGHLSLLSYFLYCLCVLLGDFCLPSNDVGVVGICKLVAGETLSLVDGWWRDQDSPDALVPSYVRMVEHGFCVLLELRERDVLLRTSWCVGKPGVVRSKPECHEADLGTWS